jgi:pimeloyl-ACP methyl ester carboxylesterase
VVLIPSMLVLARSYRPLVTLLAEHSRVLTIELPGSGRGSQLERPWTFEDYAHWLGRCLPMLGLQRPTVIGHSDSGAVALGLAAFYPELVGRVVLADSVGVERQPLLNVLGGRAVDAALEWQLTASGLHHPVYNLVRHWRNFVNLVAASAAATLPDYIQRVRVPALIAWGGKDHTMPARFAAQLQAALPRASVWRSSRGSHDWLIVQAGLFSRALRSFVEKGSLGPI